MPPLDNPRHERFAQELAKGKSATEAYEEAGYKRDRGAASRLSANVSISDRVAEIQSAAAEQVGVTVAGLTVDLLRIATKAEKLGEASGLSVARASIMDAAKLNGLVVDKSEAQNTNVNFVVSGEPVSEAEWEAKHAAH